MWLNQAEYDRLVRQLESAQLALELERAENRRSERHWANMFMRRLQTFPLSPKTEGSTVTTPVTDGMTAVPVVDDGERRALIEAGAEMGVSVEDVDRLLELERIRGTN